MRSPIIIVRPATPADVGVIIGMIRALAEYENLSEQCAAEAGPLCEHLFGPSPPAEVLIAEVDGSAAGFALFFQTYSTFLTRPPHHVLVTTGSTCPGPGCCTETAVKH